MMEQVCRVREKYAMSELRLRGMRLLFILCALLFSLCGARARAQISGRVYNAETGEILPYVTVAVKGRSAGVFSDREGRFELRANERLLPTDSVFFSCVGFDTETRTVGQFADGGHDISLRPGVYDIEPVVITNRKSRLAKLGHSSGGTGMIRAGWFDTFYADPTFDYHGVNREGGVPIKIRHDSEILSFRMLIRGNGYERALFRLAFYSVQGDTPGEPVVHKDIRFEVKDRAKGRFEVDLAPYDIRLAGGQEILVTLTLLEDEMNNGKPEPFMLNAALLGSGVYDRKVGSEIWERVGGVTMTMYLNARVYKD